MILLIINLMSLSLSLLWIEAHMDRGSLTVAKYNTLVFSD